MNRTQKKGFTLVEILVSTAIMAMAITATLQIMVYLLQLNEANQVSVVCMNQAQGMMDEIKNTLYIDIVPNYNNMQFNINELTNRGIRHSGVVYATEIEPNFLINVKIVVCWENRNRVMGEDINFNGFLDGGEDTNGNGELDSPLMLQNTIRNPDYK
jgi:prepilin-type N-terminal cleavage/methylation domain-containing protein